MTHFKTLLLCTLVLGTATWSCASASHDEVAAGADADVTSPSVDADVTGVGSDPDASPDANTGVPVADASPGAPDARVDVMPDAASACSIETGVYDYCNNSNPCSCDNVCGKSIIQSTTSIDYTPIGSMCLAECNEANGNADCPNAWEQCGKMRLSDPQAFCMPIGRISGTWRARIFTSESVRPADGGTVAERYLENNPGIAVDVGWWDPAPGFTKGLIRYEKPAGSAGYYYVLSLVPDADIEYDNVVDQWIFEVYVPAASWRAGTLSLSTNRSAFAVQPMLRRIVKPNVSMRTWLHGAVRTTSTFTITNAAALCTNLDNPASCGVASGSFSIELFGLSGTTEEQ